ncbi:MAG: alpha-glucan phosphorylase, partial [Ktedonobacterales bacterium]|nr:alpha-glucan phosphorylase [Ktedonobacterales bacterium]
LYTILEHEIVPLYYDRRSHGIPQAWVRVMKEAIRTVAPTFSMRRMVKEYVARLYMPALRYGREIDAEHYALARELTTWSQTIRQSWKRVAVHVEGPRDGQLAVGVPVRVTALVQLGSLRPRDVRVELVAARDENGELRDRRVIPLESAGKDDQGSYRYSATLEPNASGSLVYGVRVVPSHPGLAHPLALGLARWA